MGEKLLDCISNFSHQAVWLGIGYETDGSKITFSHESKKQKIKSFASKYYFLNSGIVVAGREYGLLASGNVVQCNSDLF